LNENYVTIDIDGKLINVDEGKLCKNDLVVIQTGDIVPADLKLIEARGLEIDEFDITGELLPVVKLASDDGLIYKESKVIRGSGKGIVVAIGEQTEYGRILQQTWELNHPDKLLLFKITHLWPIFLCLPAFLILLIQSNRPVVLIIISMLFSIALIMLQNDDLFKHLIISRESKKLKRTDIQIRDTLALEQMGGIDIVCFDKTGVLTTRLMDINYVYFADRKFHANDRERAIEENTAQLINTACALCNDVLYYEKVDLANPIDKALISFAQKNGIHVQEILLKYRRIFDKPFDSENRYMACGFETSNGEQYYFAKGDPEVVYKMCNRHLTSTGTPRNVDYEFWMTIKSDMDAINQNGDTAIALAYKTGSRSDNSQKEYIFLCLLQLENSLQSGTQDVIRKFSEKGIRSMLLTGDRAETAAKIGAESGITSGLKAVLTGQVIERMEWTEVARQATYCSVFARLTPSQKGILIRQLQQTGHRVAMVGDGANDGIALKVADVGISLVNNSSYIARNLSKILINDLADLLSILEGSLQIKKRTDRFKVCRMVMFVFFLLAIYLWAICE
jgi:Ca2+-transporting ATPase